MKKYFYQILQKMKNSIKINYKFKITFLLILNQLFLFFDLNKDFIFLYCIQLFFVILRSSFFNLLLIIIINITSLSL